MGRRVTNLRAGWASCVLLAALGMTACGDQAESPTGPDGSAEASDGDDGSDPFSGFDVTPRPPQTCWPMQCPPSAPLRNTITNDPLAECEYRDDAGCAIAAWNGCVTWSVGKIDPQCSGGAICPLGFDAGAATCNRAGQLCEYKEGTCRCGDGGAWECRAQLPSCPWPRPLVGTPCDADAGGECIWLFRGGVFGGADRHYTCCGTWTVPYVVTIPPGEC